MAGPHIRALTTRHPIRPTSSRCHSAWQPKPGRRSTYRRGDSVQTTGTSSLAGPDVERLGMAAALHDIGKARIPLSILDKPGRLDPGEEDIMRRHPVIGYDLLKDISGISPEILDGVRHHHEYLEGSSYPDALMAPEISDPLRLLTISEIFAALIESRPYRPAMSRQNAYNILCGMDGKLERSLVKAFRNVALVA